MDYNWSRFLMTSQHEPLKESETSWKVVEFFSMDKIGVN